MARDKVSGSANHNYMVTTENESLYGALTVCQVPSLGPHVASSPVLMHYLLTYILCRVHSSPDDDLANTNFTHKPILLLPFHMSIHSPGNGF